MPSHDVTVPEHPKSGLHSASCFCGLSFELCFGNVAKAQTDLKDIRDSGLRVLTSSVLAGLRHTCGSSVARGLLARAVLASVCMSDVVHKRIPLTMLVT